MGIRPGACTTPIISGERMPQLTAIMNFVEALHGSSVRIIASWVNCVMLSSMLAGIKDSSGDIVIFMVNLTKCTGE
ncbi:IMP dehydrogenase [Chlamydia abortus]|uniref:IMP dehydrogenase n=1 Tax=Chlamydia abortus TaxID=83555 RepID=UPI001FD51CC1|nr:hypothetical protein [Chlamydia abortus]